MGASSNVDVILMQIKNYYIFQKKLELILKKEKNYFFNSTSNKIEPIYVINKDFIKKWKRECNYNIFKDSFDRIYAKDEQILNCEMNKICINLKNDWIKFLI